MSTGVPIEIEYNNETDSNRTFYRSPLAITADDSYLFYNIINSDLNSELIAVSIKDPKDPIPYGRLTPNESIPYYSDCLYIEAQQKGFAVNVVCSGIVFSAEWDNQAYELKMTDRIESSEVDKFNKLVPPFHEPRGFASSPDGKHLYLSIEDNVIVIFGRDWPMTGDY